MKLSMKEWGLLSIYPYLATSFVIATFRITTKSSFLISSALLRARMVNTPWFCRSLSIF